MKTKLVVLCVLLLFGCTRESQSNTTYALDIEADERAEKETLPTIPEQEKINAEKELPILAYVTDDEAPTEARRYKRTLITNARLIWGMDSPTPVFGAQVHQESNWNAQAKSHVGAQGLAQFMPSTADWVSKLYPDLAENQPYSPAWALRALVRYNKHLYDGIAGDTECDRLAFTLSAYNGGLGWVNRDKALAQSLGLNPNRYWGNVETVNAGRAQWAIKENRTYPIRIIKVLQPRYALWGRFVECI